MMAELLQQNWWLLLIAVLIGVAVSWWLFGANRKTHVETKSFDALDENAGPAARNQALIDAAPAAAPRPAPEPAAPAPAPRAASGSPGQDADDLKRIKGVGPKLNTLLISLGVTSFAQIAAWGEAEIDDIDAKLGNFQGRIRRDNWIEQARLLSAGDMSAYEGKFGKL